MPRRNPDFHFDADPDLDLDPERQQNDAGPHAELRTLPPVLHMLENRNFLTSPTFSAIAVHIGFFFASTS
jgi:hypothetical protein